jgi:hypothetical protein
MTALTRNPTDVCRMAQALAKNSGYAVFPCRLVILPGGKVDKPPTRPESAGGHGFKDATKDPDKIAFLWRHWPGDLIAVATGPTSNLDALDIDTKHAEARAWWRVNQERLPHTRSYSSYSGGFHLHYLHRDGIKNTQAKLCTGIDIRATGGYIIFWGAYGCECIDHDPPAPFPDWLHAELTYKPPAPTLPPRPINPDRAIDGVLRFLAEAREGSRNGSLFWAACRLAEYGLGHGSALAALLPIATNIGLTDIEARRTIASAQARGALA